MVGRPSKAESIEKSVVNTLKMYPAGLHLRELSRKAGIPRSTLAYHLSRSLAGQVEEIRIEPKGRTIVRLLRLRGG